MQEAQEIDNKSTGQSDLNLSSIFKKKADNIVEDAPIEQDKKEPVKKAEPVKETQEAEEEIDDEAEDEVEIKPTKKEEASKEVDYKAELEKSQKTVKDTQRSYHEGQKKLAAYKKAVEKMAEEGSLTEDEAALLLDHTKHEDSLENEEVPLLTKYFNIWDKEVANMRKYNKDYSSNPQALDQHIIAFQHLIQTASPQESKDILDELSKFEDDEVELTQQMLEMGRQYNEDIYFDIQEAGGIRNLKSIYSKKEEKLKNKIDELEKKIDKYKKKYEDHDTSTVNPGVLYGGGRKVKMDENASFDIGAAFRKQYQN